MTLRQIARSIRRAQQRRTQRVFARRWDGTTDMAARVALEEGQGLANTYKILPYTYIYDAETNTWHRKDFA